MILLTGASGTLGKEVARQLTMKKKPFKCLVRETSNVDVLNDLGATLVYGDVRDRASVQKAMVDVGGIISTHTLGRQKKDITYRDVDYEGNKNLIELFQQSGGGKFVYISGLGVTPDASFALYEVKAEIEALLENSELDYTILKPSGFFTDFTMTAKVVKKYHLYPAFGGRNHRIQGIHQGDLAFCAVDSLDNEKASRQVVPIGGPEVITSKEATEIYSDLLGYKVRVLPISPAVPKTIGKIVDLFTGSRYNASGLLDAILKDSVSDNTKLHSIFDIQLKTLREHLTEFVEREWADL